MASAATVIGLTGGIASGKSAVAALLRARGAAVVDADLLAREVVAPGQPALAELVTRFGAEILLPDGQLDRKKLGAIVFADPQARADLGRITHPRIAQAGQAQIAAAAAGGASVVFYEAALLVENGLHRNLDAVIVVAVPVEVQRQRLIQRDQLSPEAAEARIAAQLPLSEKLEAATWVIDNRHDPEALQREVERVLAAIVERFGPLRRPAAATTSGVDAQPEAAPTRDPDASAPAPRAAVPSRCALVTGFPSPAARRLIERLASSPPACEVQVLAAPAHAAAAQAFVAQLEESLGARRGGSRLRVLVGEVASIHLGLSAVEYRALTRELSLVHHLCGAQVLEGNEAGIRRTILSGTEAIIDLARDSLRLQRLVHWSSAMVSGLREGPVLERELRRDAAFPDARHRFWCDAEHLVQAAERQVPVTVLRPSLVLGDSRTGEIDRSWTWFDGLYRLIERVASGAELRPPGTPRGFPARLWHAALAMGPMARAPVHVVPLDFLVEAAHQLASWNGAASQTFHLTDPTPLRADELLQAIAALCPRPAPPPGAPGLRAVARWWRRRPGGHGSPDVAMQPVWGPKVHYDPRNAQAALERTGLTCPTLSTYLPSLVHAVLRGAGPADAAHRARGGWSPDAAPDDEPDDPLAT